MKKILIVLLLFNAISFGQMFEGNVPYYNRLVQAKVYQAGIGSVGFDEYSNINNPKYVKTKRLSVKVGATANIFSELSYSYNDETDVSASNDFSLFPNFGLGYRFDDIYLRVNYYSNLLYGYRQEIGTLTFQYETVGGRKRFNSQNFIMNARNSVLQGSIVGRVSDYISFTLGLLTNNFNYETNYHNGNKRTFDLGLEDIQYLLGLNYYGEYVSAYANYKSQLNRIPLDYKLYANDERQELLSDESFISYPGEINYGLQYAFVPNKFYSSIELSHKFLVHEEEISYENSPFTDKYEIDKWESEIILGSRYNVSEKLNIGLLFAYYLSYSRLEWVSTESTLPTQKEKSIHPWALNLSGEYKFDLFNVRTTLHYSEVKVDIGSNNAWIKDKSLFSQISLIIKI